MEGVHLRVRRLPSLSQAWRHGIVIKLGTLANLVGQQPIARKVRNLPGI